MNDNIESAIQTLDEQLGDYEAAIAGLLDACKRVTQVARDLDKAGRVAMVDEELPPKVAETLTYAFAYLAERLERSGRVLQTVSHENRIAEVSATESVMQFRDAAAEQRLRAIAEDVCPLRALIVQMKQG